MRALRGRELKHEKNGLIGIAASPSNSRGRDYDKRDKSYEHEKDRIINSKAFARLQHKTQVLLCHEGDFYRTRLRHSIEVAQIARNIARRLRVNQDLAEAIALAHDLGHPPFGHAGEAALGEVLKRHGGFEHNEQGIRVVERLEKYSDAHEGLDLMWETREGIARHSSPFDKPKKIAGFDKTRQPGVEAQVVNIGDVIAYATHDMEDAIEARLLEPQVVEAQQLWKHGCHVLRTRLGLDHPGRRQSVRALREMLIGDVVAQTQLNIRSSGVTTPGGVRARAKPIVTFSRQVEREVQAFVDTLTDHVYRGPQVARMDSNGKHTLKALFEAFVDKPRLLPTRTRESIGNGKRRQVVVQVVRDFVSGMTDGHAIALYKSIFDPEGRSLLLTS